MKSRFLFGFLGFLELACSSMCATNCATGAGMSFRQHRSVERRRCPVQRAKRTSWLRCSKSENDPNRKRVVKRGFEEAGQTTVVTRQSRIRRPTRSPLLPIPACNAVYAPRPDYWYGGKPRSRSQSPKTGLRGLMVDGRVVEEVRSGAYVIANQQTEAFV